MTQDSLSLAINSAREKFALILTRTRQDWLAAQEQSELQFVASVVGRGAMTEQEAWTLLDEERPRVMAEYDRNMREEVVPLLLKAILPAVRKKVLESVGHDHVEEIDRELSTWHFGLSDLGLGCTERHRLQ